MFSLGHTREKKVLMFIFFILYISINLKFINHEKFYLFTLI